MPRFTRIFRIEPDESDVFLSIGTASLFCGCYLAYPPLGYIVTGCIFLYLAHVMANPSVPPVAG